MLDLQKAVRDMFYELKLIDGTELRLKRPTQWMIEYMLGLQEYLNSNKELEVVKGFKTIFIAILNRNTNNLTFSEEELGEEYDIAIMAIVVKDYFRFWNEDLTKKVDFRTSQQ